METRLTVRIVGPGVRPGRIALKDLQRIVHPLEQALRALMPPQPDASATQRSAKKPAVQLLLSGIGEGSATAELELAAGDWQGIPQLEWDPIPALMAGLRKGAATLPLQAAKPIERLAAQLPQGVDAIELVGERSSLSVTIQRADPIEAAPLSTTNRTVSGRLASVDFARRRAQLQIQQTSKRSRKDERIALRFNDELAADMQRFARQMVSVQGEAKESPGGQLRLLTVQKMWVEFDDRPSHWPAKRFRWPTLEERLDNVDVDDFLQNVHGVDEDSE